jgi:hypothetical protein
VTYLWQVALHSAVMGSILYAWTRQVRLPSGGTKRHLLALLLVLPMVTAAIPGRGRLEFAEGTALLNSARILSVPLPGGFHVVDLVALLAILAVAFTIWQELLPALRRPRADAAEAPEVLQTMVRGRPGWARCVVRVSPLASVLVATSGRPGRPQLIVSRGALDSLSAPEWEAVVAHEHAHWRDGRWWQTHALFAVRLLQCYNPVALWAFREYCNEVEIACDAVAASGRDPHVLGRVLLKFYHSTDRRDVAARGALRKRVDVLLSGGPKDHALPPLTLLVASAVLVGLLPWIV